MKAIKRFGRMYVTSAPKEVYTAAMACQVVVWVPRKLHSDQQFRDASVVVVADTLEGCQLEHGTPMPFDVPITFYLSTGETIWAASFNDAFLGYSVLPEAAT